MAKHSVQSSALRDSILDAKDIQSHTETVPEWGGIALEIRGLTGAQQQDATERATVKKADADGKETSEVDGGKLAVEMLLRSLVDPETGAVVLDQTDYDGLMQKSASVLNRLAKIALRLNGMTEEEEVAMEKNSAATTSDAGVSA